jgi:formylglycine-generating enzyme required for sulfatase activity
MVRITGTQFFMGVPETAKLATEKGHVVSTSTFLLDRLEVTVAEYLACKSAGNCTEPLSDEKDCNAAAGSARSQHPMNCVSWKEAQSFCAARGKRLPTSIEWELAARGTDKRPYPWGSEPPRDQLCWRGARGRARSTTCPVGSYPEGASPYGALDMAGNVAEWTATPVASPGRPPLYDTRGGSYLFDAADYATDPNSTEVRVDLPAPSNPIEREPTIGWRCAADGS